MKIRRTGAKKSKRVHCADCRGGALLPVSGRVALAVGETSLFAARDPPTVAPTERPGCLHQTKHNLGDETLETDNGSVCVEDWHARAARPHTVGSCRAALPPSPPRASGPASCRGVRRAGQRERRAAASSSSIPLASRRSSSSYGGVSRAWHGRVRDRASRRKLFPAPPTSPSPARISAASRLHLG